MNKRLARFVFGLVAFLMVALLVGPVSKVLAHAEHGESTQGEALRTITMMMEPNLRFSVDPSQAGVEMISEDPLVIRIDKGTQVVFKNSSPFGHNVLHATLENLEEVHGKSAFHSPEKMAPEEEFAYVFEKEGRYPILCMYAGHHLAGMTATIVVGEDPPSAEETFDAMMHGSHGMDGMHH